MRVYTRSISLTLLLLFSCGCNCGHRAASTTDSWYNPPEAIVRFWSADKLADSEVLVVTPDKLAQAEELLRDSACIGVSNDRARELTGQRVDGPASKTLFLVRGLQLNPGTGKFMVIPLGHELLVHHGSLGGSAVPMKRQPLLVRLSEKPDAVYVSCSMAR
jgi:hypothetical protein